MAESARRSSSPEWPTIAPRRRIVSFPNETRNTYFGRLPGKPDTEVTADDMAKYDLLLIGTAGQNSAVTKLADRLPVQVKDGKVVAKDGSAWSLAERALGLLYYNPDAPHLLGQLAVAGVLPDRHALHGQRGPRPRLPPDSGVCTDSCGGPAVRQPLEVGAGLHGLAARAEGGLLRKGKNHGDHGGPASRIGRGDCFDLSRLGLDCDGAVSPERRELPI